MSLVKQDDLVFKILNGDVYCNSSEIAKEFDKSHPSVLKKIRLEIERFHESNLTSEIKEHFIDSSYINSRGKEYKRFDLTYLGFQMIALQYSGKKAFDNRYRFINAFKKLLAEVAKNKQLAREYTKDLVHIELREEGKKARNKLTDTIRDYLLPQRISENKESSQFVSRYATSYTTHIVYKKLKMLPLKGLKVNRDAFSVIEKVRVMDMEDNIADLIKKYADEGKHYKEIYTIIKTELLK